MTITTQKHNRTNGGQGYTSTDVFCDGVLLGFVNRERGAFKMCRALSMKTEERKQFTNMDAAIAFLVEEANK